MAKKLTDRTKTVIPRNRDKNEKNARIEAVRNCLVEWLDANNGISMSRRDICRCTGVASTGNVNLYVKSLINRELIERRGNTSDARTLTLPNSTFVIPWNDRDGVSRKKLIDSARVILFDGERPDTDDIDRELTSQSFIHIESFRGIDPWLDRKAPQTTLVFATSKTIAAYAAVLGCAVIRV